MQHCFCLEGLHVNNLNNVKALFGGLSSQYTDNQPIMLINDTVIMPRLRQNERDRAIGMLAIRTMVTRVAIFRW